MIKETLTVSHPELATAALRKPIDLYMRDSPVDSGADFFKDYATKPFWDSPDLWVRHTNTPGPHENPFAGKTNYFFAKIWNRGIQPATVFFVNFTLTEFLGTEFIYPNDFLNHAHTMVVNLAASPLQPGKSTTVHMALQAPKQGHVCWLASVFATGDFPPLGVQVWDSNDLAQKNLALLTAAPGQALKIPFKAGNVFRENAEMYRLELLRSRKWGAMAAAIVHPEARKVEGVFKAAGAPAAFLKKDADLSVDKGILHLAYHEGVRAGFPVTLPARTPVDLELALDIPRDAKAGEVIDTHLVQRDREGKVVGGFTVRVNVSEKH